MKFTIVALFLFAFTTCATLPDLEASIDKDRTIECIRGVEPILEDIFELIEAFQTKKIWQNLVPIAQKIFAHVKQAIDTCTKQISNEMNLEGKKEFWDGAKEVAKKTGEIVVDKVLPVVVEKVVEYLLKK